MARFEIFLSIHIRYLMKLAATLIKQLVLKLKKIKNMLYLNNIYYNSQPGTKKRILIYKYTVFDESYFKTMAFAYMFIICVCVSMHFSQLTSLTCYLS